jgi:signal transduction histidine kinase
MQCPRCQHESPSHAKFCLECGAPFGRIHEAGKPAGSYTDLERALSEALEQQTATAEILRVISSSPTDVQPVFDTIVANAVRLCRAHIGAVFQFDGELLHLVAHHNFTPEMLAAVGRLHPRPPQRDMVSGRAILSRPVVQIEDILADREYHRSLAFATGWRSMIAVPMLREGEPIGTIVINRREPGPLTEQQIELLKTFADQAVIAIENVRLFTELQQKNEALTAAHAQVSESLEQQTATAEILHVISRSQTDVQPVFDTIVQSAVRLCEARSAVVVRVVDDTLHLVAHANVTPEWVEVARRGYPQPISRDRVGGLAILERRVVHVPGIDADDRFPHAKELARTMGYGSLVFVPMLHEGAPIGAIGLTRNEAFTENQIAMLKTFADQAVIAIENVRLFKELEEKNLALTEAHAQVTEALEQQTATAEILRVISRSQTDVQPVFDTIVRSAVRLCDGFFSALLQFDGELIHHVANYNFTPEALEEVHRVFPARPSRATGSGRAILERSVVHIFDVGVDPEYQYAALYRAVGWRSGLWVPMLREGAPIGVIQVSRAEAGPFSDNEIELLKTFADQAVIAVENVRLFKELQARTGELTQSVEKLTALGEVSRAVSSTLDVETVLSTIVSRASQLAGAAGCSIFEYDAAAEQFELRATHNDDTAFVEALRAVPLRKGEGLMGRAAEMREPIQVADITQPGTYQSSVRDTLIRFGYRALLAVPLLREDQIIGSLSFNRKAPGEFPPEVVDVLKTFATQSALAIQNARLFREIADKSAQLEAASRHKSEFLANMSHELRTPLNAIIGFSEVLSEGMFGEINEKQTEYLQDILESGRHLLSLINDILDLSKIEAGRMELELSDFHLPSAIENALILVRERASRRGIRLGSTIDERLGAVGGDERKVKQVLLNLLSNALKFTPEGGRIDVGARLHDHVAEVSVADTGIGIAPADQEAVFEEFRQVGAADKKAEGTGLGLALSRKFIELHGGRIWVKSELGTGSTFTFTLPVGRGE